MNTNSWRQFLTQQGAHWDAWGVSHFDNNEYPSLDLEKPALVDLSSWSGLRVAGADTRKFLQGQVTCDMNVVDQQTWRRGCHCNIKGRAVFSFYCTQIDSESAEVFLLLLPQSTLEIALKDLKKYAVFSKVTIEPISELQSFGLIGSADHIQTQLQLNTVPDQTVFYQDNARVLKLPGNRYLFLASHTIAEKLWRQYSQGCTLQGYPAWNLASIRAGAGEVEAQTSGELLPQLLNFHLTQGISFTKGCYLGQEVVARMEYRGKLKRHMRRAALVTKKSPQANDPVYGANSEQAIGNIISAVKIDSDSIECLLAVTDDAFDNDAAYLDQQKIHKLQFLALPYAITK
jgi:hypothetical protein